MWTDSRYSWYPYRWIVDLDHTTPFEFAKTLKSRYKNGRKRR